ncbi:hypothetical protein AB0C33_45010 [Nonomuraea sp. NPDC048881]|uniref:hypothetical protein n=1 Tax=Nonomuraea sp. NPDC048881 TaxID=3155030 RepID=UPI0034090849
MVENVATHGYLIHEFLSSPACNDVTPCHVFAWTADVTPPANEWYVEDAQTRRCSAPGTAIVPAGHRTTGRAWSRAALDVATCGGPHGVRMTLSR